MQNPPQENRDRFRVTTVRGNAAVAWGLWEKDQDLVWFAWIIQDTLLSDKTTQPRETLVLWKRLWRRYKGYFKIAFLSITRTSFLTDFGVRGVRFSLRPIAASVVFEVMEVLITAADSFKARHRYFLTSLTRLVAVDVHNKKRRGWEDITLGRPRVAALSCFLSDKRLKSNNWNRSAKEKQWEWCTCSLLKAEET